MNYRNIFLYLFIRFQIFVLGHDTGNQDYLCRYVAVGCYFCSVGLTDDSMRSFAATYVLSRLNEYPLNRAVPVGRRSHHLTTYFIFSS